MIYRVENKYRCLEHELFLIESRISFVLQKDGNQYSEYGYQITSVYFDDYNNTMLNDTSDGVQERDKYRIRIYNDDFSVIKLEVKHKRDSRIRKSSVRISYEQMVDLMNGKCIQDEGLPLDHPITKFNNQIKQYGLHPTVIVEYDRAAYLYDYGNVRITFDRNIRWSTEFGAFIEGNHCAYTLLKENNSVLEVKYDEYLPGFIKQMLEGGQMRQSSNSKYLLCREESANVS